jgi:hypothetical protein
MLAKISKRTFSSKFHPNLGDIILNYKSVTEPKTRLKALVKHSIEALKDPTRADAVSAVGDLSS